MSIPSTPPAVRDAGAGLGRHYPPKAEGCRRDITGGHGTSKLGANLSIGGHGQRRCSVFCVLPPWASATRCDRIRADADTAEAGLKTAEKSRFIGRPASARHGAPATLRALPLRGPISADHQRRRLVARPGVGWGRCCRVRSLADGLSNIRQRGSAVRGYPNRFLNRSDATMSPPSMKAPSHSASGRISARVASRRMTARMARMKWVAGRTSAMCWARGGMPS